jgi:formate dehydrogenase major subunit
VRSRYGEAVLPLRITTDVKPGEAFATFQVPSSQLNRLIGPQQDPITHTPEYKVTSVRVEPA